jgi:hypothetical protein
MRWLQRQIDAATRKLKLMRALPLADNSVRKDCLTVCLGERRGIPGKNCLKLLLSGYLNVAKQIIYLTTQYKISVHPQATRLCLTRRLFKRADLEAPV